MGKSKYKLQAVVELRKRGKENAARIASQKRRELELEKDELRKREKLLSVIRAEILATQKELSEKLAAGTPASAILSHKDFIEGLRDNESDRIRSLNEQKEAVERAEQEYDASLALLAEASKELSAIEKHRENWESDEKKRENKKEQKLLDEIGSILHERSKKL